MTATTRTAVERLAPDRLFIGGEWVDARSGARLATYHPATGELVAEVAEAREEDVDAAVAAARAAFDAGPWPRLDAADRAELLWKLADAIAADADRLARLEVLDTGKPIREAQIDLRETVDAFRYYAGWATKLHGQTIPVRGAVLNYTLREPVGVVGAIIPWNFPLLMAAWKVAPALACGNAVVLKPAEQTPLTALELAALAARVGLPPGVLNVVPGYGETAGAALVRHPGVDKIAFTGSTAVGRQIGQLVAGTDKALTLELGGKAANIIFEDAALDQAVEGIVNGIYFNQGEVCCAGSRLLVQESVVDVVIEKLKDRLATLRVGDPLDKNTDVGAINSRAQLEKIEELVASGVAEGAEIYQPACQLPERGYFFRPTLFTNVAQSHRIAREEIFGPVLSVLTFRTPDEAIEKANNTEYGLSAGIWTEKGSRILEMARRLRAGVVWANTYNKFDPTSPFGGYKESGFGREGGLHGLLAYVRLEDR